jgi:bifunctional non-homologous end joining protein LigD
MSTERLRAGRITVDISNADKVLFPDDGITKADLARYYQAIAGEMLPWLRDRPVAMVRYPDGIGSDRIMQKNVPQYFPDWVSRATVPKQGGGSVRQVICDKPATLVYLASQACIEVHSFLSRLTRIADPDQLIFDLDPPDGSAFGQVRTVALELRKLLADELGLTSFVKTTGGNGLHVHVPLNARADFEHARGFAGQVTGVLAARLPDLVTTEQRRQNRGGRIYLDIMRNGYAQLAVAPYAVRARPGAPVATPLHWTEVDDARLRPGQFTIATVPERVAAGRRSAGPWAAMRRSQFSLAAAREQLRRIGQANAVGRRPAV